MGYKLFMGALGLVFIFLAAGIWLYEWVLGDTLAMSTSIAAPTISMKSVSTVKPLANLLTTKQVDPVVTVQSLQVNTAKNKSQLIYEINQEGSEARFIIFEVLRGVPTDVVGVSDQIAAQISLDRSELSKTQVGEILVNARALTTDDDRRNQAIRNRILNTDQYEFIRFQPTEIIGLQGEAIPGQSYHFQVLGNLTIREITKPVIFEVTMTAKSVERMTGFATTTIQRSDFNLIVPDIPFVADVGTDIHIEIDLVLDLK